MDRITSTEVQILRRRALWFRQFGRWGAQQERSVQNALADTLDEQATEAERRIVAKHLP